MFVDAQMLALLAVECSQEQGEGERDIEHTAFPHVKVNVKKLDKVNKGEFLHLQIYPQI
jgi:hypothetical protein